jgi:hypothetical protein
VLAWSNPIIFILLFNHTVNACHTTWNKTPRMDNIIHTVPALKKPKHNRVQTSNKKKIESWKSQLFGIGTQINAKNIFFQFFVNQWKATTLYFGDLQKIVQMHLRLPWRKWLGKNATGDESLSCMFYLYILANVLTIGRDSIRPF